MNSNLSFNKFCKSQQGATSIEYGLAAIAMAVLLVAILIGDDSFIKILTDKYSILASEVVKAVVGTS
ncbi:Flp family type IVb pilin [Aggregatibacter kilianii]|uniref:Flp family type IVb pilin n=1 Tax=Aggregatibacter kilianii TaxID=2025884 RepID=UPI000D650D35|nr:Flp family type IVb pilin [Aggregatibacter kilianii]